MNILVIDDELRLRKVVALYLTKSGHKVIEANNCKSGIELALSSNPDVITVDLLLPDGNGLEIVRAIRAADNPVKDAPIVVLSASVSADDMEEAKAAGANKYITKPFSPKELMDNILELKQD